jgi:hypothetical protein
MNIMQSFFEDHRSGMTPFQEKYFVLANSNGTAYGQYHQALRELMSRVTSLQNDLYSRQGYYKLLLKLERLEEKFHHTTDERVKREAIVEIKAHRAQIVTVLLRVKENWRSFQHFYRMAEELKAKVGELSSEARMALEREEWVHHLQKTAALNYLGEGRIRTSTWRLVQTLPAEDRVQVNALMTAKSRDGKPPPVVAWYLEQSPAEVFGLEAIPSDDVDIRGLLPTIEEAIENHQTTGEKLVGLPTSLALGGSHG